MRQLFLSFTLVGLSLLFISFNALGQQPCAQDDQTIESICISLRVETRNLFEKYKDDSVYSTAVTNIRDNALKLINIFSSAYGKVEPAYKCVLISDISLIDHILKNDIGRPDLSKKIGYLENVFRIRARLVDSYNLNSESYSKVEVTIHVTKAQKDQQGYQVAYSTAFWYDSPPIFYANNSSSPTIMNIPPGEYIFHVMKNKTDMATLQRTIGDEGSHGKQQIELPID